MTQNYFSIEVDTNLLTPTYGSLNLFSFKQLIDALIITDENLLFFQNNKNELLDIIINYDEMSDFIFYLIGGESRLDQYLEIIERIPKDRVEELNKLFDFYKFQLHSENISVSPPEPMSQIQVAGSYDYVIISMLIVIGASIYNFIGRRNIIVNQQTIVRNFSTDEIVMNNEGKCRLLIINFGHAIQKKILKITVNPINFQPYLDEIVMYDMLRTRTNANVAEYTQGIQDIANYNPDLRSRYPGNVYFHYEAFLDIDGTHYEFNLSEIAEEMIINRLWSNELKRRDPIQLVYIVGNYYEEIVDFYKLLVNNHLTLPVINVCVQNTLTNIERAFMGIGFIHGDMKVDNILIDLTNNASLIFDLDFSFAFQQTRRKAIDDDFIVNRYLLVNTHNYRNQQNYLTRDFLHFFDIYLFNMSLQTYVSLKTFRSIFNEIGDLCENQAGIADSFKYFYIIYKLTEHYELYKRKQYEREMFYFENIFRNFNQYAASTAFSRLRPFARRIFDDVAIIINAQAGLAQN
jgi:hypothetical protein